MAFRRPDLLTRLTALLGNGRAVILAAVAVAAPAAGVHAQSPIAPPPVPGAPAEVTAFVDVAVIPMDSERVLPGQTVLVQGGRITALGPVHEVKVPAEAARIDGRGKYLIPGLADMHTHLRGSSRSDYDSAAAERRLFLWLTNGVTTIRNVDYHPARVSQDGNRNTELDPTLALRLRARAAAGELLSPRIYTSGPWAPEQYIGETTEPEPQLDSIAAYVTAYKAAGYDFIKIHDEKSVELLDSLTTAARRVGMPVMGHAWASVGWAARVEPETPAWAARAGLASIEHLTGVEVEGHTSDTARIRALAIATQRAGIWHCPTLLTQSDTNLPFFFVKTLQDAGVGVLLGTDAPLFPLGYYNPHGYVGAVHLELQKLVHAGLTPYQALATGTRNVAVFFKTLDETGTVAVGKRADLLLLRGNPLQNIRNAARQAGVMIGGRWLSREEIDRRLATFPADEQMYFYQRVVGGLRELYWNSGEEAAEALFGGLALTAAQQTSFEQLRAAHTAQWTTLTDSVLGKEANLNQADTEQALRLVARQLGEYRAALSSAQRKVFDPKARAWGQRYDQQGYRAEIPGLEK